MNNQINSTEFAGGIVPVFHLSHAYGAWQLSLVVVVVINGAVFLLLDSG